MVKDRRVKGCPNERCEMHILKVKQDGDDNYCSKCGERLIYVCAKCFRQLEGTDEKGRICRQCEVEIKDKRVKGCPNESCEMHKEEFKYANDDNYCVKCGTKLIYVCAKCFGEIEDNDEKRKICYRCEAEAKERSNKVKDTVVEIVGGAVDLVPGGKNIDAGVKIVGDIAKGIFKKKG